MIAQAKFNMPNETKSIIDTLGVGIMVCSLTSYMICNKEIESVSWVTIRLVIIMNIRDDKGSPPETLRKLGPVSI